MAQLVVLLAIIGLMAGGWLKAQPVAGVAAQFTSEIPVGGMFIAGSLSSFDAPGIRASLKLGCNNIVGAFMLS